jgi:hypothetical protein
MTTSYQEGNRESLRRLRELVSQLDNEAIAWRIDVDWTVGAVLAHLAFWDESCVRRWEAFDREGAFVSLNRDVVELINTANLPTWRALTGSVVRELVLRAAEAADARTGNLSPAALAYVEETGRTFILDRASHRNEHVEQIEEALAG